MSVYQYREQTRDYNNDRLERKEEQIKQSIHYTLRKTTYAPTTENLGYIFQDEIYEIADVQNINFDIYDLEGQLIRSSRPKLEADTIPTCLDSDVLNRLNASSGKRYVQKTTAVGDRYQASYTYIIDGKFKPIGILNIPYLEDNSFNDKEAIALVEG